MSGEPGRAARGARRGRRARRGAARRRARSTAARAIVAKAGARLGLGLEPTVVALAGPDRRGQVAALQRARPAAELAAVGRRRPTTSAGQAAVWGDGADALLDWLEIGRRHRLEADGARAGSCCSTCRTSTRSRRPTASRRIGSSRSPTSSLWVVEPQKYADARLHERYLRPLASHAAAMAVVLNQADLLSAGRRRRLARGRRAPARRGRAPRRSRCSSCRRGRAPACPSCGGCCASASPRGMRRSARLGADVDVGRGRVRGGVHRRRRRRASDARSAPGCWPRSRTPPACRPSLRAVSERPPPPRRARVRVAVRALDPAACGPTRCAGCGSRRRRGRRCARRCRRRPTSSARRSRPPHARSRTGPPAGSRRPGRGSSASAATRRGRAASRPARPGRRGRRAARLAGRAGGVSPGCSRRLLAAAVVAGALWLVVLAVLGYLRIDDVVPLPGGLRDPDSDLAPARRRRAPGSRSGSLARLVNGARRAATRPRGRPLAAGRRRRGRAGARRRAGRARARRAGASLRRRRDRPRLAGLPLRRLGETAAMFFRIRTVILLWVARKLWTLGMKAYRRRQTLRGRQSAGARRQGELAPRGPDST